MLLNLGVHSLERLCRGSEERAVKIYVFYLVLSRPRFLAHKLRLIQPWTHLNQGLP